MAFSYACGRLVEESAWQAMALLPLGEIIDDIGAELRRSKRRMFAK